MMGVGEKHGVSLSVLGDSVGLDIAELAGKGRSPKPGE
jgi:hypothetical protein